jgi:hypothetical protein
LPIKDYIKLLDTAQKHATETGSVSIAVSIVDTKKTNSFNEFLALITKNGFKLTPFLSKDTAKSHPAEEHPANLTKDESPKK